MTDMSDIDRAGAVLEIDLGAIVANWRILRERVAPAECAAVVKADAYGTGAAQVGPALASAGCRTFFVAHLDEGVALRQVVRDADIAVLNGLMPRTEGEFRADRLTPVLNDLGQIERWRKSGGGDAAIVHVDTSMSRLGLPQDEIARLAADPGLAAGLRLRAVMSHFACADEPGHALNAEQIARFEAARLLFPGAPGSLAASSGIFLGKHCHYDLVRPGVALYGVNPTPAAPNPMRQAIGLKAKILQVRDVDQGVGVGYGATHLTVRPTRIATLAAGYADGLPRSLSGRGTAVAGGRKVPFLGRVSMDLITIDVTECDPASVRPGALVELIGPGHDVDSLAAEAGTIGYEILTGLGPRYRRVYQPARG